ncbi:NADH dehydrogenase [ubiquinone] 1 beta subcomplex subunit 8, mitochondrial [Camponotus floridanus]|uniref:NADH dehydrogenase [ubiquinone] 1 beta subcomplex subunit 8, mitochondrial n=1 Tax=Camponotus floridanus TaxID=104421 RepID=E2AFG8_CAMFO|nr:NADH dehydrogenase [ubiquinone] 1 beta subcomplex subunit 8, mitochondrial [Camponotus floridanus]EFN67861.1 NADH dehydrogenase [ubiquinone] 1 beta subcomplex subunit 8, mitochondrial [Camponotus floridanus]
MAPMSKLCGLSSQLFRNKAFIYSTARCYSDRPMPWPTLWQPKKYQEKDHDKSAEKYNIHPKEYKPLPQEESLGDYPDLPLIGPAAKDPYYPYDIPTYKKNYMEPVHHDFNIMGEDRFSYGYKYRINLYAGTAAFLITMTILLGISYLCEPYPTFMPMLEKQYPQKGKVHYTFEPNS